MTERTNDELIERGLDAAGILESPIYRDALEVTETNILAEWRAGTTIPEREKAHAKLLVLQDIIDSLSIIIQRGADASAGSRRLG